MGELGVPALTRHTLRGDIHSTSVICALSLYTGCCYITSTVLTVVCVCGQKKICINYRIIQN